MKQGEDGEDKRVICSMASKSNGDDFIDVPQLISNIFKTGEIHPLVYWLSYSSLSQGSDLNDENSFQ